MNVALRAVLIATGSLSVAIPAWVVTHPPTVRAHHRVTLPRRIVPQAELPPVEPVRLVDLSPDDAHAYNDNVPFSTAPNPAARPFRLGGTAVDMARATDCLAAAVIYEAGDDGPGQRAVAQVILNRLRHPAFPKSVCGVVFEGADRSTGCQFTFTCDGALARWTPSEAVRKRARAIASAALTGAVYRPVGYSTHYHTDWVVPYWQASLDKVAAVHTHLFFRWAGWWGTPPAFGRGRVEPEPLVAKLAAFSEAHRNGSALVDADAVPLDAGLAQGNGPNPLASDPDSFLVTIPRGADAETLPAIAAHACGERRRCKYSAWIEPARAPTSLPLDPAQIATMSFSYLRDRDAGLEKSLWNCQQTPRPERTQCMKQQVLLTVAPIGTPRADATPNTAAGTRGPTELDGIRRRPGGPPAATPTPRVTPTSVAPTPR